ncbi:adhesin [Methanobrevibacter sp.]|uniref:TrmB family transcriptional regulator sugar-binding domain-containing protein n=1 Tax=Methanobrevibacter sp. TaxID=66852 RepID=UPI0026DF983B|nr:adhesin [Methanobrevibacter sp.]MDO5824231.1 adhesin [Methanobrevibacter sp.]
MKEKFTIIDYILIILVIGAIAFAFIHITTDESSEIQKTAFDASTINKIPDTYSNYYKDGYIVKAVVDGFNASDGEKVTVNGTVKWIGNNGGTDVKILIEDNKTSYLVGLYKSIPEADVYVDKISLETDGSKYENLVEVKASPEKIQTINDLNKNLSGADFEISTTVTLDSFDLMEIQEITNIINSNDKRLAIKTPNSGLGNSIILENANGQTLDYANSVLGNINGLTDEITIRVYNCSDSQLDQIKNNYDVINIRKF